MERMNRRLYTTDVLEYQEPFTGCWFSPEVLAGCAGQGYQEVLNIGDIAEYKDSTGLKIYELTNHLGNVTATISDKHIPKYYVTPEGNDPCPNSFVAYYEAEVLSSTEYYPYGSPMPGRSGKLYKHTVTNVISFEIEANVLGNSLYVAMESYRFSCEGIKKCVKFTIMFAYIKHLILVILILIC